MMVRGLLLVLKNFALNDMLINPVFCREVSEGKNRIFCSIARCCVFCFVIGDRPISRYQFYFNDIRDANLIIATALGSIMNARWVRKMSVDLGSFCTAQGTRYWLEHADGKLIRNSGALKQAADVGTAVWYVIWACGMYLIYTDIHFSRVSVSIYQTKGWQMLDALFAS